MPEGRYPEGPLPVLSRKTPKESEAQEGPVFAVQRFLSERGYRNAKGGELGVDGEYGKGTAYAVSQFQKDSGIKQTGAVDEATWNAMENSSVAHQLSAAQDLKRPRGAYLTGKGPSRMHRAMPGADFPEIGFEAKEPEVTLFGRKGDEGAAERRAVEATSRAMAMPKGMRSPLTEALGLDPGVVYSPKKIGSLITMAKRGYPDALKQLSQMGVDARDLEGLSGAMMEFQLEAAKIAETGSVSGDMGETDMARFNALKVG